MRCAKKFPLNDHLRCDYGVFFWSYGPKILDLTYSITEDKDKIGISGYITWGEDPTKDDRINRPFDVEAHCYNPLNGQKYALKIYGIEVNAKDPTSFIARSINTWKITETKIDRSKLAKMKRFIKRKSKLLSKVVTD